MSKPSKSQKASEIKDLLLDVIQQEESNISDTEIYRLSQPYKKPQAAAPTPRKPDIDLELNFDNDANSEHDHVFGQPENFEHDSQPNLEQNSEQSIKNYSQASAVEPRASESTGDSENIVNDESVENRNAIVTRYDEDSHASHSQHAEPSEPDAFSVSAFENAPPPPVIAPFVAPMVSKVKSFQSDQTVKLNSPPPSRAPIELAKQEVPEYTPSNPNEATIRLSPKVKPRSSETESRIASGQAHTSSGIKFKTEVQVGISSPAEAVLKQSENLRIAQARITSLEEELERLRQENSHLSSAGEILRRRADELLSQSESFENKISESAIIFEEEKKVLKAQIQNKDKELDVRKQKVDQLEQRLNSQFDSIRRRERELEHRLEILKVENQDILSGKDKMILDLKRQVDLLNTEANFSKERTQDLYTQHKDKQDTIRRVVKALRMALTILEGDEDTKAPLKKVD